MVKRRSKGEGSIFQRDVRSKDHSENTGYTYALFQELMA